MIFLVYFAFDDFIIWTVKRKLKQTMNFSQHVIKDMCNCKKIGNMKLQFENRTQVENEQENYH